MEITEDRTREQKAEDHRMADARHAVQQIDGRNAVEIDRKRVGLVPGASEVECGNYRDMDLPAAKAEAAAMLPVLEALTAEDLHY